MLGIGQASIDASWGFLARFFLAGTSAAAFCGHACAGEHQSFNGIEASSNAHSVAGTTRCRGCRLAATVSLRGNGSPHLPPAGDAFARNERNDLEHIDASVVRAGAPATATRATGGNRAHTQSAYPYDSDGVTRRLLESLTTSHKIANTPSACVSTKEGKYRQKAHSQ